MFCVISCFIFLYIFFLFTNFGFFFRLRLRGPYQERNNRFLKLEILVLVEALAAVEVPGLRKFLLGDYLQLSVMTHSVTILKLMAQ